MSKRVVMISGANRGIGFAVARQLLESGWRLSLGVRSAVPPSLELPSERVRVVPFEARSKASCRDWVETTVQHFGRLDALVNNAGVHIPTNALDEDDEEALDEMLEVNCKALWRTSRAALPWLEAQRGRIVNIVSVSGKWATEPNDAAYCISKFAAMGASEVIRLSAERRGVGVTAVCPGWVDTDMSAGVPAEGKVKAQEVASTVLHVLHTPSRVVIPEIVLNDTVGLHGY